MTMPYCLELRTTVLLQFGELHECSSKLKSIILFACLIEELLFVCSKVKKNMRWTPDRKPSWWSSEISFVSPDTISNEHIATLESYKNQMNLDEDVNEEMELQDENRSVSGSYHPPDSDMEQGRAEHQKELPDPGDDMEHQDQISIEEPQPHWKKGLAGGLIVTLNGV